MIDQELLDILVCPACKAGVELHDAEVGDDAQGRLVCTSCGLRYPIRDDIPIMLVEEAAPAESKTEA